MPGMRSRRWWRASVPSVVHGERLKRKKTKENKQTSSTCRSQDSTWSHTLGFSPSGTWSTGSGFSRTLSAYFYSNLCLHLLKMFGSKSTLEALHRKLPDETTYSSASSKEQWKVKCAKERCHQSVFPIWAQSQQQTPTPTVWVLPQRPPQSAVVNWVSLQPTPATAGGQGRGSLPAQSPHQVKLSVSHGSCQGNITILHLLQGCCRITPSG